MNKHTNFCECPACSELKHELKHGGGTVSEETAEQAPRSAIESRCDELMAALEAALKEARGSGLDGISQQLRLSRSAIKAARQRARIHSNHIAETRTATREGMKRYPPDGRYEEFPCTCHESCPKACKGEDCGCKACNAAFQDFGYLS